MDDLKEFAEDNSMVTCRAMYNVCLEKMKIDEVRDVLNFVLDMEIDHMKEGQEEYLDRVIEKAIEIFPNDEHFWIKCTKDLWKQKSKAKKIVNKAIEVMPSNENILLLASKLEREDGQIDRAREILNIIHDKTNMN